jgi:hypothetical protein
VAAEHRQNHTAQIARCEAFYSDLLDPHHGDGEPPLF